MNKPKIQSITIENFRSIGENPITIKFPNDTPLILIGENNAGKSNILKCIDLMFGEWFPKSKDFEDHDFHGRNPSSGTKIIISVDVVNFNGSYSQKSSIPCGGFLLEAHKGKQNYYAAFNQTNDEKNTYVSNELRNELSSVLVNVEQNLSYQLSYSSKFTLLSKVTKAFHDRLVSDQQRVDKLKIIYDQMLNIFNEVEEFSEFKENMSSIAGEMITNMSHGLDLDFSAYDPSNYFKSLKVNPQENGNTRTFDEIGSGQQQILALSFAHAYAKSFKGNGLILLLDEPESHLHPLAQKWLARTIFDMATDGLQIVITTHSPYFIDLSYLAGINLIRKNEDGTDIVSTNAKKFAEYCLKTNANKEKISSNTVTAFYKAHSTENIIKGFFSNKIILVEGLTEELSLPIYLRKLGLDTLREGIDIISVNGKGNLSKWWRFFTHFRIPVFICFDNDLNDDKAGTKRVDALKTIGISSDDISSVLKSDDWNINSKFCVFGKDFETTMRKTFQEYEGIEETCREILGDSKPILAREVANLLEYQETNQEWNHFKNLVVQILNLRS